MINLEAIHHMSGFNYCYPLSKDTLRLRLRTKKNNVDIVTVVYQNVYLHTIDSLKYEAMEKVCSDKYFDYFEKDIFVKEGYFKYYFKLEAEKDIYYCQDGFLDELSEKNYFYYSEAHESNVFNLPQWAKGLAIYQIFIDRFLDGDASNNPANTKSWGEAPDRNTYFGGDFLGIIYKLDYIKSLGMSAIYLSPVHPSPNYHKYDISDYEVIEEYFGGKEKLIELVQKAHKTGLKIILDGVFNHCSIKHIFFQDLLEKQEKSNYVTWFKLHSFPVSLEKGNYDSFGNLVPTMPKFNTSNSEVINYLTNIAAQWTEELDIDGWRLDVGDELSHEFLRTFREKIKAVKADAVIIGESWNISSRFMLGNEFDTLTNYKNRELLFQLVDQKISVKEYIDCIYSIQMQYKSVAIPYLLNLIGSHDTIRIASYYKDYKKWLFAFSLALFLEGGFVLYYGDEKRVEGLEDPDNRRAMNWNVETDKTIQKILQIRQSTEFCKGNFNIEKQYKNCIVITRDSLEGKIRFIGNLQEESLDIEYDNQNILLRSKEDFTNTLRTFDFIIYKI
ncbi:MAG: alpha-glycosidase [Tenericutes bacterium]|nr:alpha-glycosidase [Mycoplasmatota bacterium]